MFVWLPVVMLPGGCAGELIPPSTLNPPLPFGMIVVPTAAPPLVVPLNPENRFVSTGAS